MDINFLRALSTVFVFVAFIGVCWWAFAPKRRKKFEEAAQLPFADEAEGKPAAKKQSPGDTADETKKQD